MKDWEIRIVRTDNGYIMCFPMEVSDNGHSYLKSIVIKDSHEDDLYSHEDLLFHIMEYFEFLGDGSKEEQLIVIRQRKGNDYESE